MYNHKVYLVTSSHNRGAVPSYLIWFTVVQPYRWPFQFNEEAYWFEKGWKQTVMSAVPFRVAMQLASQQRQPCTKAVEAGVANPDFFLGGGC